MSERYGRKYFSISEIKTALQCGAQHHFRYVRRIRKPTPVALLRGSAYDAGLRALYEGRIAGEERTLEDAQAAADAYLDRAVAEEEIDWGDADPEAALEETRQQVRTALGLYFHEVWPDIRPVAYQQRFEVEFEGLDWTFLGYIDLVLDGEVWDDKLYSRTPNQQDVDLDLQLTAYAFGYQQLYGRLPERLGIQAVVLTKKAPKMVRIETRRTQEDIDWFLGLLGQTVQMLDSGLVVPRPGGWYCSPTACPYWAECRAMFGGGRMPA